MSIDLTDERLAEIWERASSTSPELISHTAAVRTILHVDLPALRAEVERLKAERQRAIDALDKPGRDAVATSGDLEDGINMDRLHLKAERPEPPDWADVHDVLAEHRDSAMTDNELTDAVMGLFGGQAESEASE